ncbi:ABC transporter permease, partial [Microbacterium sp.]|uniref:ABC transporter permease n=1 Tax=Microbacterium sp. TaxID=51671 RepID=UPI0035C85D27
MSETTTLSVAQQKAQPARRGRTTALTLLLRNPSAMVGAGIILFWTLGGLITAVWSPYPPNMTDAGPLLAPPSAEHLFGTDNYGRDLFSRVLAGARVSLWTGVIAIAVSLVIGVPLGAIAGYFRGSVGMVIMRVMDMLLAFPSLLLAMALAVALGPGLASAMIAVGIVG